MDDRDWFTQGTSQCLYMKNELRKQGKRIIWACETFNTPTVYLKWVDYQS